MDIPESIVIDITELDIMDSVHIEDVAFPEGVTPVFDENYAVLSITAMQEEAEEEEGEVEEEAAEEEAEESEAE
jgi:large subunit ribosomal protein L25